MADSDKNILITPSVGKTGEPTIVFRGKDNIPVTLRVLDDGTLSFEGSSGQLFSITDSLTGTIFSVNDISGIPSLEITDDGTVRIAEYAGNVGIGLSSPTEKLDVSGNLKVSGSATLGSLVVSGNATINGTTTTINSTTVTIDDPIFTLGGDTAPTVDDNKDRGIEFRWHDGTSAKVGFFGLDDSSGKFTFIPDATNTSEVFAGTKGTIDANIEWADVLNKPDPVVTVTLQGEVTGTANTTLTDLANGTITVNTVVAGQTTSTKTDSYTLVTSDANKIILMDKATAQNVTIDSSLDLSVGQRIDIIQSGAGQVTFVASGATVNATPGLKMRARYSAASVICVATDSYVVVGDLSA